MSESTLTTRSTSVWSIDPAHSVAGFGVKHMMISTVKGRFGTVEGTIRVDEEEPENSSVEVEIDAASIDTREEKRDQHLRSADFLDVQNHPKITFRSTRLDYDSKDDFRVVGELTIRGTTRTVELEAREQGRGTDPWGGERVAFRASTEINRKDFGLEWNQVLETGGVLVGDRVRIDLEVQAVLQDDESD